jgi:hypothetical protein
MVWIPTVASWFAGQLQLESSPKGNSRPSRDRDDPSRATAPRAGKAHRVGHPCRPERGFFPRGNAVLIAVGVACFFLSDVCVGFYRSLPKNQATVFTTYLTWISYAPALVPTAFSSYDLDRVF